jgi:hypothetical protein
VLCLFLTSVLQSLPSCARLLARGRGVEGAEAEPFRTLSDEAGCETLLDKIGLFLSLASCVADFLLDSGLG